uniref:RRM domain-containing protein n=1 Tax=Oryza rufipogon TaxID=4529 RepID=A0A0E0QU48_ORYRU
MPELRWSCCLCAQAFHLIDMVLQPQQAGPMMPLLAQPPLAMALLYSSFNIWTTLMSYVAGTNQSAIPLGGMARYSVGMDSGNHGATRTESRTLYVEGLPSNCTKREIFFAPFLVFVRWKVYNLLCFVDFATPSEARAALETLQGQRGIALRSYVNLRFSVLYVNAKEMARAGLTHKQEPEEGGQLIGVVRRRGRERHALGDAVGSGSGAEKSWAWGRGGGSRVRRRLLQLVPHSHASRCSAIAPAAAPARVRHRVARRPAMHRRPPASRRTVAASRAIRYSTFALAAAPAQVRLMPCAAGCSYRPMPFTGRSHRPLPYAEQPRRSLLRHRADRRSCTSASLRRAPAACITPHGRRKPRQPLLHLRAGRCS